jgi:hypothetical protein
MQAQLQPAPEGPEHPAPDYFNGSLTRLRPVLESDLAVLAPLMSEAPRGFSWDNHPWTVQRLKKKFDDEHKPGLWSAKERWLAITDPQGAICGLLMEERDFNGHSDIEFHIRLSHPQRAALGRDALEAYLQLKQRWFNPTRIQAAVLSVQADERSWLEACGFNFEFTAKRTFMYLGQAVDLDILAWHPQWVLDNRAPDGIGQ